MIVLFDATTGQPRGVLSDNGYLTELRTGAAGALATDLLAPTRIQTVGILGTGTQARYQIRALTGVRDWRETLAWGPNPDHVARFCAEMWEESGVPCRPASSPEAVVTHTQLLYTVTPSTEPLVRWEWIQPGSTVIAVGADAPHKQELHGDVLRSADKVVPDDWSQAMRVGELRHAVQDGLALRHVHGELGKVMTGELPGRGRRRGHRLRPHRTAGPGRRHSRSGLGTVGKCAPCWLRNKPSRQPVYTGEDRENSTESRTPGRDLIWKGRGR